MSVIASQLVGQVSVSGVEQAIGKLITMGNATDDAGKKFALLAGGGVAIAGAALVGIGVASVKMAGDFQQGMTTLVTGAGESASNIKLVGNGILDLAVQTGTSTKKLTDGMFMIESAGYHGSQGLNVLKVAAEGAKVGNADLGVVANAMTTYMQDYHVSANHAAEGMNFLTAVVSNGKTHLQDLASSLSTILPLASAYGVKSSEVGGAIAVMTNAGMSAQNATHGLANALRALEAPNAAASKSLLSVGLSSKQVVEDIKNKGLPDAIQLITDAVGKKFPAGSVEYNEAMKKVMGGATGLNVALMLGGKNMAAFQAATKNVADALKGGGDSVTGWANVQQDFNFKMSQAKEVIETLMIRIGTGLLPVLGKILDVVTPLIMAFSNWITASNGAAAALGRIAQFAQPVANVVQHMASLVENTMGVMAQRAATHTLQMRLQTIQHTSDMARNNIANIEEQAQGIEQAMRRTHSAATRHMLQMKLDALQHSSEQSQGVIRNMQSMQLGVQQQLAQLTPAGRLHMLSLRDTSLKATLDIWHGNVQHLESMRNQLEMTMLHTHSASTRHMLQMRIDAIDHALAQKQGVVKAMEDQRKGVESAMAKAKAQMNADNSNILTRALAAWDALRAGIGTAIGAIGNVFKPLLPVIQQIGALFVSNFIPAWHQLQAAMIPLMPALKTIGQILGGVLVIAIGILIGALVGLAKGVASAIGGIVTIITGLVTIFTGVFNVIGGIVMFFVDLVTLHFDKLQGDLGQIGTGIVQIFKGMWTVIVGVFQAGWGLVSGIVTGFVQGVVGYFTGLYETLVGHSIIPDMVNGIVMWIAQLPSRGMQGILDFISQATSQLGSLGAKAAGWAADMINQFVGQLQAGIGRIGDAVSGIASTIAAHLHFSVPDVGPLKNADTFMPDFMDLLAKGMDSNVAKVKASADRVAASIGLAVNPNVHVTGASLTASLARNGGVHALQHGTGHVTHHHSGHSTHHSGASTHHHATSTHHHAASTHHHAKSTHHHAASTHHHAASTHHHTGHSTHHHTGTSTHHYSASTYAGLGTAIASAFNQQPIKVEVTLKSANQPVVLNINGQQMARTIMPLIVSSIRTQVGAKI